MPDAIDRLINLAPTQRLLFAIELESELRAGKRCLSETELRTLCDLLRESVDPSLKPLLWRLAYYVESSDLLQISLHSVRLGGQSLNVDALRYLNKYQPQLALTVIKQLEFENLSDEAKHAYANVLRDEERERSLSILVDLLGSDNIELFDTVSIELAEGGDEKVARMIEERFANSGDEAALSVAETIRAKIN